VSSLGYTGRAMPRVTVPRQTVSGYAATGRSRRATGRAVVPARRECSRTVAGRRATEMEVGQSGLNSPVNAPVNAPSKMDNLSMVNGGREAGSGKREAVAVGM